VIDGVDAPLAGRSVADAVPAQPIRADRPRRLSILIATREGQHDARHHRIDRRPRRDALLSAVRSGVAGQIVGVADRFRRRSSSPPGCTHACGSRRSLSARHHFFAGDGNKATWV
jgi:hypothetical protein